MNVGVCILCCLFFVQLTNGQQRIASSARPLLRQQMQQQKNTSNDLSATFNASIPHAEKNDDDVLEKSSQRTACRPGRAIIDFSWTEPVKGYRKYNIQCGNITMHACEEKCEFNVACTRKEYGEHLYVRGIWVIYNRFEDTQTTLYFLCCNTSNTTARSCSGHLQKKESQWIRAQLPFTFREAKSTYANDGLTASINPTIYFESCSTYIPGKDACPYVHETPNANTAVNSDAPDVIPDVVPDAVEIFVEDCCCESPWSCCASVGYSGSELTTTTAENEHHCIEKCYDTPGCTAMEFDPVDSACYLYTYGAENGFVDYYEHCNYDSNAFCTMCPWYHDNYDYYAGNYYYG